MQWFKQIKKKYFIYIFNSVVGNGYNDVSSKPGWGCLHFTWVLIGQTGFFNHGMASDLGDGKSLNSDLLSHLKTDFVSQPAHAERLVNTRDTHMYASTHPPHTHTHTYTHTHIYIVGFREQVTVASYLAKPLLVSSILVGWLIVEK